MGAAAGIEEASLPVDYPGNCCENLSPLHAPQYGSRSESHRCSRFKIPKFLVVQDSLSALVRGARSLGSLLSEPLHWSEAMATGSVTREGCLEESAREDLEDQAEFGAAGLVAGLLTASQLNENPAANPLSI